MENQEKMPKKLKISKKYIVCLPIVLVFAVVIFLLHGFSCMILPSSTQMAANLATPQFSLFLVSLNSSNNLLSMESVAGDYQGGKAGGYIWKLDDRFHIIYGCYEKENDATLVQKSLKQGGQDSQIVKVDFPALNLNGDYDAQSKKVLSKALKSFYNTYLELFDISASLDTNVYNDISARLALNGCYSDFNSCYTDFKTLFGDLVLFDGLERTMQTELKVLESLCSGKLLSQGQTFSSLIKYRYTEFVYEYFEFLQSMAK